MSKIDIEKAIDEINEAADKPSKKQKRQRWKSERG